MNSYDDLDDDLIQSVLITHDTGLRVLVGPTNLEDSDAIPQDKLPGLVEKLSSSFDYIVVDMSSDFSALAVAMFDLAERIVLVVTPTLPGFKGVKGLLKLFEQLSYPEDKAQIVFNRVTAEYERTKVAPAVTALETNLRRKALGVIPMDEKRMLSALNKGTLVISRERTVSPAKDLLALADALHASIMPPDDQPEVQPNPSGGGKPQASRLSRLFGN
jgi:pilus assembly protein CpaE